MNRKFFFSSPEVAVWPFCLYIPALVRWFLRQIREGFLSCRNEFPRNRFFHLEIPDYCSEPRERRKGWNFLRRTEVQLLRDKRTDRLPWPTRLILFGKSVCKNNFECIFWGIFFMFSRKYEIVFWEHGLLILFSWNSRAVEENDWEQKKNHVLFTKRIIYPESPWSSLDDSEIGMARCKMEFRGRLVQHNEKLPYGAQDARCPFRYLARIVTRGVWGKRKIFLISTKPNSFTVEFMVFFFTSKLYKFVRGVWICGFNIRHEIHLFFRIIFDIEQKNWKI